MKNTFFLLPGLLLFAACKKSDTPPAPTPVPAPAPITNHPQMRYTDLNDFAVTAQRSKGLDIDGNGSYDFVFYVQRVGDPQLAIDKVQYNATSGIGRNLLLNDQDESPVLRQYDSITLSHPGFNWWQISETVLAEQRIGNTDTWWEGLWRNVRRQYLPVQVERGNGRFNGWVEVSMDKDNHRLLLHRAAISLEAGKTVRAGY
ncbi:hypothetical protein EPD60_05225 [Flaviaesturariibacter flavus]|uniref:Lipoprotein n=1 Tax=Flaviaesturariibacter flavus TaxID=2502780 RepID=A0A4R1BK08_9BACT|nr:hypothetical protein [Flaviaesturariibacter flavus]TCJ17597.1 hypothetical protein EPD60_05225 [Flaviaesturariibacter flavus]